MAELLVALGASASTVATVSTITSIAGPVLGIASAVSQVRQGNEQGRAQQAEFNRQAREERVTSGIRAARERREARVRQSRDRLVMLEGGSYSGTAFDLLRQNRTATEMDIQTGMFEGEQRARSAEAQGRAAREASRKSPLRIFSAAIDGFSQMDPLNIAGQV
jgi:hypothetical protein